MPKIASHHSKSKYALVCEWPDDCYVQWGGNGIVLSSKGGRSTAFFEAFPAGEGFFRGEGASIEDAERDCFRKLSDYLACDHLWGRGFTVESRGTKKKHGLERPKLRGKTAYTNGGAICRKCKSFASRFKPITPLGDWKSGPGLHELTMAAEGSFRSLLAINKREGTNHAIRSLLRIKAAGINLPEIPEGDEPDLFSEPDEYILKCRKAVVDWYVSRRSEYKSDGTTSLDGLFKTFEIRIMEAMVEEELEYQDQKLICQ